MRLDPHDGDALQTKLFLLLQTDQYAAALAMTEALAGPSSDTESDRDGHLFEKAYSLYRLHREEEATEVLRGVKEKSEAAGKEVDRGILHLEAQLVRGTHSPTLLAGQLKRRSCTQAYRQASYQTACDLYTQLLDTAEPVSSLFDLCSLVRVRSPRTSKRHAHWGVCPRWWTSSAAHRLRLFSFAPGIGLWGRRS